MNFENLKKVPLAEFCLQNLGYTVNNTKHKKRDSKLWRSLKSRNGYAIFTKSQPNARTGHYLYRCDERDKGGTIIDLLIDIEGLSLKEINERYCSDFDYSSLPSPAQVEYEEEKDQDNTCVVTSALRTFLKDSNSSGENYYKQRGLDWSTLDYFGSLYVRGNQAFLPLYRRKNNKWVVQTSIIYKLESTGERSKLFQKGLKKKGAYSILKQKGKKLVDYNLAILFESPIDALSYYQIHKIDALYISTCGTLTNDFKASIPFDLQAMGIKEVILAFDNDEAGKRMIRTMQDIFNPIVDTSVQKPSCKDWNEQLSSLDYSQFGL